MIFSTLFSPVWLCLVMVLSGDPPEIAVTDYVDLVEVNHYFDNAGKPVFNQLIFYNWDEPAGRYNVCAWRLLKNPSQVPVRNPVTGKPHHAMIRLHTGFEFRDAEMASGTAQGTGEIQFDFAERYAFLSYVHYTPYGMGD